MTARRPSPRLLSLAGKPLQRVVRVCCARPALPVSLGVVFDALGRAGVAMGPRLSTEVQSLAQKLPNSSNRFRAESPS